MPTSGDTEPLYVAVGSAIRDVRGGMSQDDLAAAIGKNQRTLSAYEDGRVRVPLHLIPEIERACGARKGAVMRKAGLVEDSTEAAIEGDPDLTPFGRRTVLGFYRYTRDEFDEGQSASNR